MSETTQGYLDIESESTKVNLGFQSVLNHIRERARSEYRKGELFEQLMQKYFTEDPDYKDQFSEVYLWKEWAQLRSEFDGTDIGVDLVAQKHDGGYCAIQCKCYAPDTRISKGALDSFLATASLPPFADNTRILVNTGGELGENSLRTIEPLGDKFRIIRFRDLEDSPFEWPDLSIQAPEQLTYKQRKFNLKDHQQEAFDDVINGFKDHDRGKLIMACGTGKTFTALKIAEEIAGTEGRVLYLVPSISLLSQAMREWSDQRGIPHSYVGICSDTRAGDTTEDSSIQELKIPVTTNPSEISRALHKQDTDKMTVVFCTYQSLPLIEEVQNSGAPPFDIIFCDEAHRTTGVDKPGDKTSPFVLVHDADRIRANKRLYMTATPRLYTENARKKAADYNVEVFSMDDEEKYGPQFHRLPFSKAVELGELSDYKVAIFGISEHEVNAKLAGNTGKYGSEININDATRIIGCWRALQNPENKKKDDETLRPLKRVIAFTNRIDESKALAHYWNNIIEDALEKLPEDEQPTNFLCETEHVDGTVHALNRKTRLDWLKSENVGNSDNDSDSETVCRILSNARCLSEGIDVPALDAVIFYKPRKSHIDVVQAVGRVMRKAPGKQFGYVILPVAIPDDKDPAAALNDNERFSNVWSVLNALRSHDDRFDGQINSIDLNKKLPDSIVIGGGSDWDPEQLSLLPIEIPVEAILPKIVEKCGDKRYWENWAKDVAEIFDRLVDRIQNLLDNPENATLRKRFESFHNELKKTINTSITRENAMDMMAQHILTSPVFDALFEDYDFSSGNPVANALDNLQKDFAEFGLESETRDLQGFYDSVRSRVSGVKSSHGRQEVLSDLYEQFFKKALKKEAERLGIAYTPIPLVDFVLHSVNDVLQEEFGKTISDENVHVLDPFTGTGTFIVQLLQSGLIQPKDLERKYRKELHANEILLLAYYIASVNIEEAFRGQRGGDNGYEPFEGIILTDTFNLNKSEKPTLFPKDRMLENNERAERQQKLHIEVIVGNPPWSAGQKNATDDNPNVEYPEIKQRITDTYADRTTTTLKRYLYDTYKMAIRWASDRIGEHGVIAFVTPASWIDGNAETGIRECLAEEFSSIYVLNLLGNARIHGEQGRYQGGGVFGNATQSPVAITILVKNLNVEHSECSINYRDIGGELRGQKKLEKLKETVSISGFSDWQMIKPNKYHEWIKQRSDAFTEFYPLGTKEAKAGVADDAIFRLYSPGMATNRDAYIYNFSRNACAENAQRMAQDYLDALSDLESKPELSVDEVIMRHSSNIKWNRELEKYLKGRKKTEFEENYIRKAAYRPFIATNCYADYTFIAIKGLVDRIFPDPSSENRAICIPNRGARVPFSVMITDTMLDLNFFDSGSQCFPLYQYTVDTNALTSTFQGIDAPPDRIDNISDTALHSFRAHYRDNTIIKDDIFDYVYGILHAPSYREQFANDLSKMLPHIPYAPDFHAFAEAGKALTELHLNYETCKRYPRLEVEPFKPSLLPVGEKSEHFLLGTRAMRFADKSTKDTLIINEHICLTGIPDDAHHYLVDGRTPLEWFINRYKIKTDKNSGITNDPNGWFENPRDLITAIERIVYVSIESTKIIDALPSEIE